MWGQLPCVQDANRKNAMTPTFSHCQQTIDKCLLTPNSLHLCMKIISFFFLSSTRLFYSWITFSITFTLHICQSMCQHSWSVISALKYSPAKAQSWRSGHPKLSSQLQPPRENPKPSKNHTNDIYDKLPWKCQSRDISEILIFTFSSSFMEASKENREENSSLESSFLPTAHMATNPALHGFSRLKNLSVKLARLCNFTSI